MSKFLKMFGQCVPVKGASRSLIADIDRGALSFITNDMVDFIKESKTKLLSDIDNQFKSEYLEFILENEFGFLCDEALNSNFPEISDEYELPNIIDNAIIDFDFEMESYNFENLVDQLIDLGCRAVEIRFYNIPGESKYIINLLDLFKTSRIEEISICADKQEISYLETLLEYSVTNPRLRNIILFGSEDSGELYDDKYFAKVIHSQLTYTPNIHCGYISQESFVLNRDFHFLSKNYNSCLYKKIGIGKLGEIKVCTTSNEVFGFLSDDLIKDVVQNTEITKLWYVNKDQVETCKICEFRYICSDCRMGVSANEKPINCTYDPIKMTWND